MNIQKMHIGVRLEVQKIASNRTDDLIPQEIDYYLNEAIEEYIESQFNEMKTESRNVTSQYVNDNLRTLIATVEISPLSAVDYLPNSVSANLPNDYRFYIFSRTLRIDKWINNRKLEPKAIKSYLETATNIPIFREFPVLIEGNTITVIGDTREDFNNNTEVRLTYIKNPSSVIHPSVSSDLPDHTHKDIVKIAAMKILRALNVGQAE